MRKPWYFVLPEERTLPSGGNIYNEHLIATLQSVGQPVNIISVEAYINAVEQDQAGVYWVDTLMLDHLDGVITQHPQRACSLLIVHHLNSLSPAKGQSRENLLAQEILFLNWFQGFLVTSSFTGDYLRQQGLSQSIIVVEPGIASADIVTLPKSIETVRALMVANLVERKGILPWLHQLARLLQPTDSFSLTIVGRSDIEVDYANRCRDFLREHPLLHHRVRLAGSQHPQQMPIFYQQANLLVSAAIMETFGMALQEARAHRLPILAVQGGYTAQHIA